MAQRRMFSPEIVGSDAFIEMSVSAQMLYFHLGMRADDDGFVNPQITMRMIGANIDDLRLLLAKRFLLQFENGVVVVKHWRINNFIRKDRYKATTYLEQKKLIRVKENMAYTLDETQGNPIHLVPWKSDEQARLESGQPKDIPQVDAGKDRLGKDRLDKEEAGLEILRNVPEELANQLSEKYKIDARGIRSKATDLLLYCESKGKRYKNYKAFLENAVRKDKIALQRDFPLETRKVSQVEEKLNLDPKMVEKTALQKQAIREMLRNGPKMPKK